MAPILYGCNATHLIAVTQISSDNLLIESTSHAAKDLYCCSTSIQIYKWLILVFKSFCGSVINDSKKNENNQPKKITFYPNPANQTITLNIPIEIDEPVLSINNIQGRLVMRKNVINSSSNNIILDELNPGFYLIKLESNGYNQTSKLIINK